MMKAHLKFALGLGIAVATTLAGMPPAHGRLPSKQPLTRDKAGELASSGLGHRRQSVDAWAASLARIAELARRIRPSGMQAPTAADIVARLGAGDPLVVGAAILA